MNEFGLYFKNQLPRFVVSYCIIGFGFSAIAWIWGGSSQLGGMIETLFPKDNVYYVLCIITLIVSTFFKIILHCYGVNEKSFIFKILSELQSMVPVLFLIFSGSLSFTALLFLNDSQIARSMFLFIVSILFLAVYPCVTFYLPDGEKKIAKSLKGKI
ncbi:MAG: hypothetical protein P0Y63_26800 [Klebsiella huaxiensis]|uniref:hypothetical protein n=1 Tax=Klebsiella huaxiensis TaxID=2153354 RepID=UPI0026F17CCA|nr:hypothetical protein [Klebsiella huaxiensis]WEJ88825.1 MAG: hypothetical protein P0Y63_26800 [Klebsiella huaxiensis]